MKKNKIHTQAIVEVVAAIALGILAVICFGTQMLTFGDNTTTRETALFNLLQFGLTVGFTWFGSRAISRKEYEANLKSFALGAYRRICDIERMLERLQSLISGMVSKSGTDRGSNLQVVRAVVDDTKLVISSSISDWADIIGEEMIALSEIERLESKKNQVQDSDPEITDSEVSRKDPEHLQSQIDKIWATLPAVLRSLPREKNDSSRAPNWMAKKHIEDERLRLQVVTGSQYSDQDIPTLQSWPQTFLAEENDKGAFDLIGEDGKRYGRVMNFLPLDYDETMGHLKTCFGTTKIKVETVNVIREYTRRGKNLAHVEVRVLNDPIGRSSSWLLERAAEEAANKTVVDNRLPASSRNDSGTSNP